MHITYMFCGEMSLHALFIVLALSQYSDWELFCTGMPVIKPGMKLFTVVVMLALSLVRNATSFRVSTLYLSIYVGLH